MNPNIRTLFQSVGPLSLLALLATHCSGEVGDASGTEVGDTPGTEVSNTPSGDARGRGDSAANEPVGEVQSALLTTACVINQPHGGSASQQQFTVTVGCIIQPGFHRVNATAVNTGAGACSIAGWTTPSNPNAGNVNVSIINAGGFGNGVCTITVTQALDHSLCVAGDPLSPATSGCAGTICSGDPFCCTNSWDSICVGEVRSVCQSLICTNPPCAHSECAAGSALASTCSPSVTAICARDPFCCANSWDNICIREVADIAGKNCNP